MKTELNMTNLKMLSSDDQLTDSVKKFGVKYQKDLPRVQRALLCDLGVTLLY